MELMGRRRLKDRGFLPRRFGCVCRILQRLFGKILVRRFLERRRRLLGILVGMFQLWGKRFRPRRAFQKCIRLH